MNGPLTRPEPRRIVLRAVVDALIADADREISSLEVQVEEAVAAADAAEARLAELGFDERASAWATVQLERFVTELRADAEAGAVAVVEEARVRARLLVEEADAEACHLQWVAAAPTAAPASPPRAAPDAPPASRDALAGEQATVTEPDPVVEPVAPEPVAPEPVAPEPTASQPTASESAPAEVDRDVVFHEITPEALASDLESLALADSFWPSDAPRKRRFTRARTVAVPTLAGLLVVAAVVLRVA